MKYLVRTPIDIGSLVSGVSDPSLGGTAAFAGSVRRSLQDGPVKAIEYTAYDEMAEGEMHRIVAEAEGRWPGARIAVQHRLGTIPLTETSVVVVVAAPHRAEAFEACRWVIEAIKERVPIWKKEIFADGSASWRGNDGTQGSTTLL